MDLWSNNIEIYSSNLQSEILVLLFTLVVLSVIDYKCQASNTKVLSKISSIVLMNMAQSK